jgi:hypothetical protein
MGNPLNLQQQNLDEDTLRKLSCIEHFDLGPMKSKVMQKLSLSPEAMDELEIQTKQFIALSILEPEVVHSPPPDVDKLWHEMILNTKWYSTFCATALGQFLHHNPIESGGSTEITVNPTLQSYEHWFGYRPNFRIEPRISGDKKGANCNNNPTCNNDDNCNNSPSCNNDDNCNNSPRDNHKSVDLP